MNDFGRKENAAALVFFSFTVLSFVSHVSISQATLPYSFFCSPPLGLSSLEKSKQPLARATKNRYVRAPFAKIAHRPPLRTSVGFDGTAVQ